MTAKQNYFDDFRIYCFKLSKTMTLVDIGKLLGKHYTTIIHHIKKYHNLMAVDKNFQDKVKVFNMEAFKEIYAADRERKAGRQKEKLTVRDYETKNSISK